MLTTKRLIISPIEKKDLSFFLSFRNDPDTSNYLTQMAPINEYMQEEWFKDLALSSTRMYFTISSHDDTRIGIVRCDEWDKVNNSIRIGIDIDKNHRRNGYAEEAYQALIPYLFHKLNIHRIWLLVVDYNTPAISLYKKLGFHKEGAQRDAINRDHTYHDYVMMSLLKSEFKPEI